MAQEKAGGKMIAIGFILTITAIASAFILPELFSSILSNQASDTRFLGDAIRIALMIAVILIIGFSLIGFMGGDSNA